MYKIVLTKSAIKDFDKLDKSIKKNLKEKLIFFKLSQ